MATARLDLESLDPRLVPTTLLDLTARGAVATAAGAVVEQADPQPTGTGYIRSFVRVQGAASGGGPQQGLNTDGRPLRYDENKSPQFTRSITLGQVPVVTVGGVAYREFLLDINQKASAPHLSLDAVRVYLNASNTLTSLSQLGAAAFDLDAGGDVAVKLNARLNSGSGSGDMRLLIPDAAFAGQNPGSFLYLYSAFGGQTGATANGGFEEWAVKAAPASPPVTSPPPATGSVSGRVFVDHNQNGVLDTYPDPNDPRNDFGLANIPVELRYTDAAGLTVSFTTTTDGTGAFAFTGLAAGTYTVIAAQSTEYADGAEHLGSEGGTSYSQDFETEDGGYHQDWFVFDLGAGVNAANYFFTEQQDGGGPEL